MKRFISFLFLFFFCSMAPTFGQAPVEVVGYVDSTANSVKVHYTTDDFKTIRSVTTDRYGYFRHELTADTGLSQQNYICWVMQCDSARYDTASLWYNKFVPRLEPRLEYCHTFVGCLAVFEVKKLTFKDSVVFAFTGSYRGRNLLFGWKTGDGRSRRGKDSIHHEYTTPGRYKVVFTVRDSVNGYADSAEMFVETEKGIADCRARFAMFLDLKNESNLLVYDSSTGYDMDFHWSFGDGDTSIEREPSHVYKSTGRYSLCLKVSNKYCQDRYCQTFTMDRSDDSGRFSIRVISQTAGLDDVGQDRVWFRVFPNPNKGDFFIDRFVTEADKLQIRDITGRSVAFVATPGEKSTSISLANPGKGVYIISYLHDDVMVMKRFVVN